MQSIFVCNTAGDSLSEINLMDYSVKNYPLDLGERPVGPNGMICCNDKLVISDSYNNSISIFSLKEKREVQSRYIGAYPNEMKIFNGVVYAACSDSNSIVEADLDSGNLICNIPLKEYPYSIEIDEEKQIAYVSNTKSNIISIIDLERNVIIDSIRTYENPTKIFLSKDNKKLYLCESYIGKDIDGYITIISTESKKVLKRIRVGMFPINFVVDENKIYVTNFSEGSLSIVDINKGREIKKIHVSGMPKGIIKRNNDIFVGDHMNGRVFKINLKERIIKNITVGREPNAMILVDYHL